MPAAKHLDEDRLRAIHAAAIGAGLAAQREELLLGIDPAIANGLPIAVSRSAQILSDVFHLADITQRGGVIPLIAWLHNALRLAGSSDALAAFEGALQQLGQPVADRPASPRRDRRGADEDDDDGAVKERRGSRFIDRVEQICRLKEPAAIIDRRDAPYPFTGVLEVVVPERPVVRCEIVATLVQPPSDELLADLVRDVVEPSGGVDEVKLIYQAPAAPADLVRRAFRHKIRLISFDTYQGLIDFGRYRAWLSQRLDTDLDYPPWLYVDQPADISVGGQPPATVDHALDRLCDLIATPEPRFALVLGKFGAGKTFLLREVARRLLEEGSIVPVLVEMRFLEKESSLRSLLSQHFGHADAGHVDLDRFLYMLRQGKIALLFDGFDELAVRVTYDRVLHYFATVLEAVGGNAKVVVSSRTEHFLDDRQIKKELARRAEEVQGYRLISLRDFGERQVQKFLRNRLQDEAEADARHALIREVHDLLGLSENPRMLSFIADLEREQLAAAQRVEGEITPAKLYELLLGRWLTRESKQADVSLSSLWAAVRALARTLWAAPGQAVDLGAMPRELLPSVAAARQPISSEEARLVLGSRSLLKRDAEGMFSFVHRSVLEWLVADEAARELSEGGRPAMLVTEAMSPLMARFFAQLANRRRAEAWAREVFGSGADGHAQRNALMVARELGVAIAMNLEDCDLRGESMTGMKLIGANLRRANLEGVVLSSRDLTGAMLVWAALARSDLRGAILRDADLSGADLTFTDLRRADLTGAKLDGACALGAKLIGARGLSDEVRARLVQEGAAVVATDVKAKVMLTESPCCAIAFHPLGHLLATGHNDGTVRLWEATSGTLLRGLQAHTARVWSVAFSPNGRSFASSASDHTVKIWDLGSAARIVTFSGHAGVVWSVAYSPDGKTIASGADDRILLWDPVSGRALSILEGHSASVLSVAYSPDGRTIASGSDDKTIRLWNPASGQVIRTLTGHRAGVRSVAWSPDGRLLASGSNDHTAALWDAAAGGMIRTFQGHKDSVWAITFSPNGRTLATGSADARMTLWDPDSGAPKRVIRAHTNRVCGVAWSPDGRQLASASYDTTAVLWDEASGTEVCAMMGRTNRVCSVAWSPDGRRLASGSEDSIVSQWDPIAGTRLHAAQGHTDGVVTVAWSPDGRSLASGSNDVTVRLWDADSGSQRAALHGHTDSILCLAYSADGRTLASASRDGTIRLWDARSGSLLQLLPNNKVRVLGVAWSPDGRFLATGSADGMIGLWDPASGALRRRILGHMAPAWSVAWSPDGRTLASASADLMVALWDPASSTRLRILQGHKSTVESVAWSPDGRLLASGSHDDTIKLWNPSTGALLHTLEGHRASVRSVAFSPDGRTLASGSDDSTIRLWDVATARCLVALLPAPGGWVAFIPDGPRAGACKIGGEIADSFWHVIGLARFAPGELDPHLPDDRKLLLPEDHRFIVG